MELNEKIRLKKMYAEFPERQLIDMLLEDKGGYQEGVYELLLEEAKRRGIEEKVIKIRKMRDERTEVENEEPEEYKQIFETNNPADIAFLKSILNANGIKFLIENENYNVFYSNTGVPMILKVSVKQIGEAKELLKDFKGGKFGQGEI